MSNAWLEDLSFLNDVFPLIEIGDWKRYRHAEFLLCDFDSEVWETLIGTRRSRIDWRVSLGTSGTLLTAPDNAVLWTVLRSWLILADHGDSRRGKIWSSETVYMRFNTTLNWIDYFLLRADSLQLSRHGLKCLSHDELLTALHAIASSPRRGDGLYRWRTRLAEHLRKLIDDISEGLVEETLSRFPFLSGEIPPPSQRLTNLSNDEILAARAILWSGKRHYDAARNVRHGWAIKLQTLATDVYPELPRRRRGLARPAELQLWGASRPTREYWPVPVTETSGCKLGAGPFASFTRSLADLGSLGEAGMPVPTNVIGGALALDVARELQLPPPGRFQTVPASLVFYALRRAIEFILEHGDSTVDLAILVVTFASKHGLPYTQAYASLRESGELKAGIAAHTRQWTLRAGNASRDHTKRRRAFYLMVRQHRGAWELLRILYGAIEVVLGVVSARRVSELIGLPVRDCLDSTRSYLVFDNAKSGVAGNRERLARPIPPIAAKAIGMIQRLRAATDELGIHGPDRLFAFFEANKPAITGSNGRIYASAIDLFCDYVQMPLNEDGFRHYLRQHQLRRFFAMVFFWSNAFGGMDTLRWFLAHTDAEHLYRYITESTPGEVMRSVKAEFACEAVTRRWDAAEALADIVAEKFGTRDFALLEATEIQDFIEGLLEDGMVVVEPHFLDSRGTYRIVIKIIEKTR